MSIYVVMYKNALRLKKKIAVLLNMLDCSSKLCVALILPYVLMNKMFFILVFSLLMKSMTPEVPIRASK